MKLLVIFLMLPIAAAQSFEAASLKPSAAEPGSSSGIASETGRITGRNVTLKHCIRSAYDTEESRIFGGPKWVDEDRYDIDAKAPGPAGDHEMMIMLQSLLAERFHLVLHRETRTLAGYALVSGKKGIAAKPSTPGTSSRSHSSRRSIDAAGCDMDCLARKVSEVLHLPVANLTHSAEQLGLKLEARKVPTEVLVFDQAEKASEN